MIIAGAKRSLLESNPEQSLHNSANQGDSLKILIDQVYDDTVLKHLARRKLPILERPPPKQSVMDYHLRENNPGITADKMAYP